MLPSEFIQAYGLALPRTIVIEFGDTFIFPVDYDRYLLAFIQTDIFINIRVLSGGNVLTPGIPFAAAQSPIIFTHHDHGAMVNLSWSLGGHAAPATLTIIEGFARQTTKRRNNQNGKATSSKDSSSGR